MSRVISCPAAAAAAKLTNRTAPEGPGEALAEATGTGCGVGFVAGYAGATAGQGHILHFPLGAVEAPGVAQT